MAHLWSQAMMKEPDVEDKMGNLSWRDERTLVEGVRVSLEAVDPRASESKGYFVPSFRMQNPEA